MVSQSYTLKTSGGSSFVITVAETATSVSSNTSTIKVTAKATIYSEITSSSALIGYCNLTVADKEINFALYRSSSGSVSTAYTATKSSTFLIVHDTDGSCTISVSGTCTAYEEYNVAAENLSISDEIDLTDIPQDYLISVDDAITGSAGTVTWMCTDASYTYALVYAIGTTTISVTASPGATGEYTHAVTYSNSDWAVYITDAESASVTVGLYTYDSSGTQVMVSTASMTLTVDSSIVPEPEVALSDPYGYEDKFGCYIAGYSAIEWSIEQAAELYGASTASYAVALLGVTYLTASGSTGIISSIGTYTCAVTLTDSRGRVGSASAAIEICEYIRPIITAFSVGRQEDDSTAAAALLSSAAYTSFGGTNYISEASIAYKLASESTYGDAEEFPITSSDGVASGSYSAWESGTFAEDASYDVLLAITDVFGISASKAVRLSTVDVLLGLRAGGKGLGIGKKPEGDYLDIGMDTVFGGSVEVAGKEIKIDYGAVEIEADGESAAEAEVEFDVSFWSAPYVLLTLLGDVPTALSANDVTEAGFTARLAAEADAGTYTLHWLAIGS